MPDKEKKADHLETYYRTNQQHLQWSFWAGLSALTIGLVVLLFGIYLTFSQDNTINSSVTSAAGVLTEFIGAGFFYLYSRNLGQLNIFYEKLIKNQDTGYAIHLMSQLPENERAGVATAIIGALLSRSGPSTELTPELVRALNDAKSKKP